MIIFMNNLRRIFTKPLSIVLMIVMPIVLNATLISRYVTGEQATVGIIIEEESKLVTYIEDALKERYEVVELTEEERNDAVIDGKVDCVVVIRKGFTNQIIQGTGGQMEFYLLQESNSSTPIRMYLNAMNQAFNNMGVACEGDENAFYEMVTEYMDGKLTIQFHYFDDSFEKNEIALRSLGYLALGLMFMLGLSTTSVLKDKEDKVYYRVMISPMTRFQYLLQNILSYGVVALIQVSALFLIMIQFLHVDFGENLGACYGVSILFAVVCITLGVAISSLCSKVSTANALTSMINVPMLMLGGCFWHMDIMPEFMQMVGKCLPTYWFVASGEKIIAGAPVSEYGIYLILLAAFAMVLTLLVAMSSRFAKEK